MVIRLQDGGTSSADFGVVRSRRESMFATEIVQVRYLCHVMRQAESSREAVQRRKNSCLRDAFVFFLWHTSRHQPIAVIGGRCRSRADSLRSCTMSTTEDDSSKPRVLDPLELPQPVKVPEQRCDVLQLPGRTYKSCTDIVAC